MHKFCLTVLLVLRGIIICVCSSDEPQHSGLYKDTTVTSIDPCLQVSPPCITEADRFSLEALQHIHREMDDDQDGGIEVEESVEFIIEDMQQQQQANKHSKLHHEDQHITLEELWKSWKSSEVHNWTQEDVLRWLREFVELPQYEKGFKELHVNGNTLPRIASNEQSFMSTYLKIQDQQHKQKFKLKALDVVLFGPPTRPPHNWMKDLVLIVSVVMGIGGCWFARVQNKASKVHISKMMKDLESLQRAEQSLRDLQEQLEKAQEEKRTVAVEKKNLEEKMRDEIQGAQEEANRLHRLRDGAVSELSRLRYAEEELEQVRDALKRAEKDMQYLWSVPESLQLWLQLTHEVEVQYYNVKKQKAEQQLVTAKDEAEKIKKKRSSVLGTLHVAHSSSLDQVDQRILEAKNALAEVTACLRERLHRWQQIEGLCGFPVMKNAGLPSLTATLYPDPNWMLMPRAAMQSYQVPVSVEDMEEEMPQIIPQIPVTVAPLKCSPRSLVRSRRSGHIVSSPVIVSPDPDLLIPIRTPLRRYGDEEEEHIKFTPLVKQESMETSSDTDSIGSSISRMYSTLDVPPRRKYIFSDKMPRRISLDEEDSPSRKISEEETDESLNTSRKVSREELDINTPSRKTSRDELEASVDPPKHLSRGESEASIDSRKLPRDLPLDSTMRYYSTEKISPAAISIDSQRQRSLRERKDHMDSLSRVMPKAELDIDTTSGTRYSDALMNTSIKHKENLDFPTNIQRGRAFRENSSDATFDSSTESSKKFRMLGKTESSKDIPSRMMAQDEFVVPTDFERLKMRDISMDTAARNIIKEEFERSKSFKESRDIRMEIPSKKFSRDDQELAMETQRIQRKIDSSVEISNGKIQREIVGLSVEAPRRKISQEEFLVANPGQFGPPDLTVGSLKLWKSASDSLSTLVYDGILEKSYENPLLPSPGDFSHTASVSCSTQSLLGNEGQSANVSSSESGGKDKGKKSSKLKNIFKKKKEKEKAKDT
ncbi:stromal interaction molecule 2 isoform X1 [Labeo rohita]|uniref:stromal interaction molecule 2 isoform X1 n=1 Tax=Labeo rohita TaxID=84645 RepID=UPI0021E33B38|nr:stromal interaction molecule 2 isoform X1 [Labeo rohita]XP_050967045.1 stromal interaction molecule 2 isoform X1 [Labeo rohita]